MIAEPQQGAPVDELWKTVAMLTRLLNALQRMKIVITPGTVLTQGKLEVSDSNSTLTLF